MPATAMWLTETLIFAFSRASSNMLFQENAAFMALTAGYHF